MSRERREATLADFDRSGISGAAYVRLHGIRYSTFAGWLRKRRMEAAGGGAAGRDGRAPRFAEVVVERAAKNALEVELPGGVRLRVADRQQAGLAVELIRQLEGGAPC